MWGVCTFVCGGVCMCVGMYVCGWGICRGVWMYVLYVWGVYVCVFEFIFIDTRGRKETSGAKGNQWHERKLRARKTMSVKN